MKRLITTIAALALGLSVCSAAAPGTASAAPAGPSVVSAFKNPSQPAKPMVRMWFPDAQAGVGTGYLDQVADQIADLAASGFGGVEIAYLADYVSSDNLQLKERGWGSPAWQRILKTVLETANNATNDFQVDLTITAHWPPNVNNIDFNDDAASQEASQAFVKITAADLADGTVAVPLPARAVKDEKGITFVFEDKFDSAAIARVKSVNDAGKPTLELSTLTDITDLTSKVQASAEDISGGKFREVAGVKYAGQAAGVPDQATAAELGKDYEADIVEYWGPEQANPAETAKIDSDGNRKRMADWQYQYQASLSSLADTLGTLNDGTLAAGDWVLVGNYYRGTGQVQSSGSAYSTQYNHAVSTNYFASEGVEALIKLWTDNILDDEMIALLENNGGSIFEDSIEGHFSTGAWAPRLRAAIASHTGLDADKYASVLVSPAVSFDDTTAATRIKEDYQTTLGNLYSTEHAKLISDWAKTFGYNYRAQAYGISGLDIGAAAAALDIPEGDNGSRGDGIRTLAGTLNMTSGEPILSMEAVTFTANIHSPWSQVLNVLNGDASYGVTRTILHGSAFSRTWDTSYVDFGSRPFPPPANDPLSGFNWPGWNFMGEMGGSMGMGGGFTSMNDRQAWWDEVEDFSSYVSRLQSVLQTGSRSVDVAILRGSEDGSSFMTGNSMQDLLDHGYSYNVLTEQIWSRDSATVTTVDGKPVLGADGPGYHAAILYGASTLSAEGMAKLEEFAEAGLPILVVDSDVARVFGVDDTGEQDAAIASSFRKLLKESSVKELSSKSKVLSYLQKAGVKPRVQYDARYLEAARLVSDEGDYFYLHNAGMFVVLDAAAGASTIKVFDEQGSIKAGDHIWIGSGDTREEAVVESVTAAPSGGRAGPGEPAPEGCVSTMDNTYCATTYTLSAPLAHAHTGFNTGTTSKGEMVSAFDTVTVTLEGEGRPYEFNLSTGEITPLGQYTAASNAVKLDLSVPAGTSTVIGLISDTAGLPNVEEAHAQETTGGEVVYADGKLAVRAQEPGTYTVTLADQSTRTAVIDAVPGGVDLSDGWDLSIESWGPDNEANKVDPTISKKVTESFNNVSLGTWADTLSLTAEQIGRLNVGAITTDTGTAFGVQSIDDVSGNAVYTKTFTLPDGWGTDTGASLRLDHSYDNITGVEVNGYAVPTVDQFTSTVGVPVGVLKAGDNTIKVNLSTSLANRAGWTLTPQPQGLTKVAVTPYVVSELQSVVEPTPADTTVLAATVTALESLTGGNYTAESWASFQEALDAAKAVLANPDATQEQIDEAVAALHAAAAALTTTSAAIDKAVLQSVYDSALALSNATGAYTADSWSTLQAEIADAKAVLELDSATQSDINQAVIELAAAVAGLEPAYDDASPVNLKVAKVKLNQSQLRLVKGKSLKLEEGVYFAGDVPAAYSGGVTWTSSNNKVATVSPSGKVTAKKAGAVTITATSKATNAAGKTLSASVKVTVVKSKSKAKVKKVTASVPKTMKVGQTTYITGKYSPSSATGVKVTYSTSKPGVVTIDKVGRIIATSKGTDTVKVKAGGKTKTYKITVK
ncbi:MAG: FIVAR domain-containing protein [Propionibacteriaceae bacterium]|nr:FIVAR domain-containing protein [Propionibacteriaceae bacterium]